MYTQVTAREYKKTVVRQFTTRLREGLIGNGFVLCFD